MKKITKITAVLVSFAIALACFVSCADEDTNNNDNSVLDDNDNPPVDDNDNPTEDDTAEVTKEQWQSMFSPAGYTSKLYFEVEEKIFKGNSVDYSLTAKTLINGEDFKTRSLSEFFETPAFTEDGYFAKKDGKFYCSESNSTVPGKTELTFPLPEQEWTSNVPKNANELLEFFMSEECEYIFLKDKYDDFTYSEQDSSYSATFATYGNKNVSSKI